MISRFNTRLVIAAFVIFASIPSFSQTIWFKYGGNPVLNVGAPGAWDNSGARIARVIFKDGFYRAWYTGYTGGQPGPSVFPRVGFAISSDGVNWTKDDSNPVLNPGPSAWDAAGSFRPYVIFSDTTYKMWYTGVQAGPVFRIGYANSPDGIVWTKAQSANPILNVGGPGSYDAGGVEHASVVGPDNQGGYVMWFEGNPGSPGYKIGYATAPNETTWTKYGSNPVFSSNAFYPRIIYNGSAFEMWYCIGTSQPASFGYATSSDGISWTTSSENPVLRPGTAGSWDVAGLLPGDVLFDGNVYHLWYAGNDGSVFRSGYAVSPKGFSVTVSTADGVINSGDDTILVTVRVDNPANLKFSALFKAKSQFTGIPIDTLQLFDDGAHDDTLAGDGIFANTWIPDSAIYDIDLTLTLYDTLRFELGRTVATIITDVEPMASSVPLDFHIAQNYPNPFNPTTAISYQLSAVSHVSLKVYDLLGREVATLVNEELRPGTYSVTWDASGFPSGVYFYRLASGSFVETRKLTLIR